MRMQSGEGVSGFRLRGSLDEPRVMSEVKRVSPERAAELLEQGYVYVDVRSEPEFEQGHVPGALNVPLMNLGTPGMTENPDFLAVFEAAFGKSEPLLLGCRSGNRSLRAAKLLLARGYSEVCELETGFEGTKDAFGRRVPGWTGRGLPVEKGTPAGGAYADVKGRRPR
jgi:rhodanese-related sulfurtransferase